MLGHFGPNTNSREFRDVAEYVTFNLLMTARDDLARQNKPLTQDRLNQLRDEWRKFDSETGRAGERMDFAKHRPTPRDFKRLMASTGAESFGRLDQYEDTTRGLKDLWSQVQNNYRENAAQGRFMHVATDPEIRRFILDGAASQPGRQMFYTEGESARDVRSGDVVALHDVKTGENLLTTPASEQLLGWEGGMHEERYHRGLRDVLGAYITESDQGKVANNIDPNRLFDAASAEQGADLLRHMRSQGYNIGVNDRGRQNQIEVDLGTGNKTSVRVFDPENNGGRIGRVYDSYNQYYFNVQARPENRHKYPITPEDSMALMDYVAGNHRGDVRKTKTTSASNASSVYLDGVQRLKTVQVKPHAGRYDSLSFTDGTEAENYIRTGIDQAQENVDREFNAADIQALIDEGLDDEDTLVTDDAFRERFEPLFSSDETIREAQEQVVDYMVHSDHGGGDIMQTHREGLVGNYEDGFDPAFVIDHMGETGRGNERDAMTAAMKKADYDPDKIIGNDFAVNAMKERLVQFDPDTAKSIDEVEHPMVQRAMQTVQDTLANGSFKAVGDHSKDARPSVEVDDQGVIRWEGDRRTKVKDASKPEAYQTISGEIGQIMVPDENGVIHTQFQGDNNYDFVPGYTGYFAFEDTYENRMDRFRAKGFEQHLQEQLQATVNHQMTRPYDRNMGNIATSLDASSLNTLYHGDVYGKRIEKDFVETNQLDMDTKEAILTTLSQRVRFDNQYSDHATTGAETQAKRQEGSDQPQQDTAAFSYWEAAGSQNMRVLGSDMENYADLMMTGTGKTQGLVWYLTDGAEVHADGSVTPSEGIMNEDGEMEPDKTAVHKLPYFDYEQYNAWDRNQMSSNQLMTADKVDENVGVALMSFGGWTFDDSYAVSQDFADRNQVFGKDPNDNSMRVLENTIDEMADLDSIPDEQTFTSIKENLLADTGMAWSNDTIREGIEKRGAEGDEADAAYTEFLEDNGKFRSLKRGDKLSDFGGNKGTIGIIIDRDMDPEEAKRQSLDTEVAFMKENPDLDVVGAPYSMLSRHNAGVVHELMDGETKDIYNPESGETYSQAMGRLDMIVTDMNVDKKTNAYTREDVLDGKGRKASGQLAWAIQSKGADGIMQEIYGNNTNAWETMREYMIATGLDMGPDGTMKKGYEPHEGEERPRFQYEDGKDSTQFLEEVGGTGGFMEVPFDMEYRTGQSTRDVPVLSPSLRQNVELQDGSIRRSDFTNHYANMYDAVSDYHNAGTDEDRTKAQQKAQNAFNNIQDTVIDRQFEGGHNGKNSFIRDKIMGKRMQDSATGVAMTDPRLEIGELGMDSEMMDSLDAREGDTVMAFRDPVWRDGAIRAMTVKNDETVHGVSINPIADKSHDMDFDGDTMGLINLKSKAAQKDLENKFSHWSNMIDRGPGDDQLYFQTKMDLASGAKQADERGDDRYAKLYQDVETKAQSSDKRVLKKAQKEMSAYSHELFRKHGFGGDYVSLESDQAVYDSFERMVDNGAKGKPGKHLPAYMEYHNGEKGQAAAQDIQYASGVKSDDTGLAGAFSQKLVSTMRNQDITAALESMYPLTQGTLQIKHDPDEAKNVNQILTDDMNKTFKGVDINDPKKKLTPKGFKNQLSDIMENKMEVDVNPEFVESVGDTLTDDGEFIPLDKAMDKFGSPMDRVGYGGGYEVMQKLADEGRSLLEGEQSRQFAPMKMREADEHTKLAKRDTQVQYEDDQAFDRQTPEPESKPAPDVSGAGSEPEPASAASRMHYESSARETGMAQEPERRQNQKAKDGQTMSYAKAASSAERQPERTSYAEAGASAKPETETAPSSPDDAVPSESAGKSAVRASAPSSARQAAASEPDSEARYIEADDEPALE